VSISLFGGAWADTLNREHSSMKQAVLPIALTTAGAAQAHPGHLAEAAGHGHWLGAAAIGAAIAIGLWAAAKGRKDADASEADADDGAAEEEPQEV
jgi:hypothetical protein